MYTGINHVCCAYIVKDEISRFLYLSRRRRDIELSLTPRFLPHREYNLSPLQRLTTRTCLGLCVVSGISVTFEPESECVDKTKRV